MLRSTYVLLAALLCAAPLPTTRASEAGPESAAPLPPVFRGGAVSGVANGDAAVAKLAVPVLRGEGDAGARPGAAAAGRVTDVGPVFPWRLVGGEKLWFVEPESGRVIACRERNTSTVGRRAIDCTGRTLRALGG